MNHVPPKLRKSEDRGRHRLAWLDSAHSFSFGDYYDPTQMGFRSLRVINEDWIRGGGGFAPHSHKDMEILTYPIKGSLRHKDSTGAEGVIEAGDIQLMGAGQGIVHSEFNASPTEEVHLLQIWILPSKKDLPPIYQQQSVGEALNSGSWTRILRPESDEGMLGDALHAAGAKVRSELALSPRQNIELWAKRSSVGESIGWQTHSFRSYWLQLIDGELLVEGQELRAGDALALEDTNRVNLISKTESEFILFVL